MDSPLEKHEPDNMANLLGQSNEVLHIIFSHAEPADLGNLSRTCRSFDAFIRNNQLLWKELYLQRWDDPVGADTLAWEQHVKRVVRLEKMLLSDDETVKRNNLETTAAAILPLLSAKTQTLNGPWLASYFAKQSNVDCFLAASNLFRCAGTSSQMPASTPELQQLSAKLHSFYGVPIDFSPDPWFHPTESGRWATTARSNHLIIYPRRPSDEQERPTRSRSKIVPTNHVARAKVYDLREYTDGSFWGPFKDDGSQDVDWEKVEAVMVVLGYNLRLFAERANNFEPIWKTPWDGVGPFSFVTPPVSRSENDSDEAAPVASDNTPEATEPSKEDELAARDPYGITGTWMRVVCFLDYNDLYSFNFAHHVPADQSREPIDTKEAIRLIKLKLRVAKIEAPGEDDGQDMPVVWFKGTSRSLHASWDPNANSRIRGVVRQTKESEIRWTTWSIFHGEERWRSEGVQVGGVQSKRGVLGNWFDKDYDMHGPAGPTAFWKLSDDAREDITTPTPSPYIWEWQDEEESSSEDED